MEKWKTGGRFAPLGAVEGGQNRQITAKRPAVAAFRRWLWRVVFARNGGNYETGKERAKNRAKEEGAHRRLALSIDRVKAAANCKSRSEFLKNAARFYAGYVSGQEATAYLPAALMAALQGAIQGSESRVARLLFKLAVELDMMMNVMAVAMEVDKDELERLRADCVRNVKRTSGAVSFKDAVELQCGARLADSSPDEK